MRKRGRSISGETPARERRSEYYRVTNEDLLDNWSSPRTESLAVEAVQ
jgi:hypothetical protein